MISAMPFLRRFAPRPKPVEWGTASDTVLALAARTQNKAGKEAFVEIVRRHQTAVCAVAYGISGRIALTEDIAQETFLYAWKHMTALREPAKLKAWLTKIARSTALDVMRREQRTDPLGDDVIEIASLDSPPDTAAADAEDEKLVWDALAELPENYRLPLALFYNEGQSIAAVAATLELSEDAVKQRLSRGREALREKVAACMAIHAESKLEGVLRRVQPSALLVVTIATAIGLLAAPAALAAGAFSGAMAATTSGSAATASTFSTAMTASSYLVATITLAAFIPLGWKAREPEPPVASAPVVLMPAQPADPFAAYPNSALLKEWRRLHEEHGSDAAAMPVLYASIADIKDDFRRRALRSALLAEWAAVDPAGAFQFLHVEKKQGDHAQQFMREWLALDAPAAAAFMAANVSGAGTMARGILKELAGLAPEEMVAIARLLPASQNTWDRAVQDAFSVYAGKNPDAARAAAEAMTGASRAQALAGVAQGWAEKDGAAALAWSRGLTEGPERDGALRATLLGWAKSDPIAALDHVDAAPPGSEQMYSNSDTASQVLRAAAEKDFTGALAWLQANSGKIGTQSWLGLADALGKKLAGDAAGTCAFLAAQPEAMREGLNRALQQTLLNESFAQRDSVWAWAKANPGPLADEVRAQLMGSASWNEPQVAMRWLADFPDNESTGALIESRLRQLLTEPRDLAELDALLADAPEKFRGRMLAVAMGAEGIAQTDARPWAARISQLPEESRAKAAQFLADSMAAADPQEAIAWSATLSGEQQTGAVRGLMGRWARSEPEAASIWVRDQPDGPLRDAAAESLTQAIAYTDPAAAWVWAGSIGDLQTKQNAYSTAALAIHQRDPARAQQMLQSGQADPAARVALENVLGLLKPAPAQSNGATPAKIR